MDFLERINGHFRKKLPFVVYRKPNEDTVKVIFQNESHLHHLETYTETGFAFAPFDVRQPTVLLHPDEVSEISAAKLSIVPSKPDAVMARPALGDKAAHIRLVNKGIDEINEGLFQKVVLSRCVEIESKALPLGLFQKLMTKYGNALCYLWYHPKVGLWLGATPEILLALKNGRLTTMSLAGTQQDSGTEHPKWEKKELEEQQMVTNYIADALTDRVDQLVKSDTETVRAGNLLHLRTKITGVVAKENLQGIIEALHPTPAVCGMPKESARQFIADHENYERQYYTGFLGELNLKTEKQRSTRQKNQENQAYKTISRTTTLYVNLRCMQMRNGKAIVYVGGGITKGSNAEREWEETVAKSSTMLSILR